MSQPHICPSCSCVFHQDFVCTTCGAEKLYGATVKELRERCAFYERTNAEQAAILNRVIAERDDYRAALEYKSKREEALKARDLKCVCDHNEYCGKCFPLDFREGGMFCETPDSVMRNALAKYPRKADELEGKK